jgi:hypothetical protein
MPIRWKEPKPTLSKDKQEALSRKYSNDVVIMLPLSSGNIAIFNNARELFCITTKDHILYSIENTLVSSFILRETQKDS